MLILASIIGLLVGGAWYRIVEFTVLGLGMVWYSVYGPELSARRTMKDEAFYAEERRRVAAAQDETERAARQEETR